VKFGAANAEDFASLPTDVRPAATSGGTDPGLQSLPPRAAGTM
jgi:hypothetical protein